MLQVSVKQLYDDNRGVLQLARLGAHGDEMALRRDAAAAASLIGHLNLTHPNSIQVLGGLEARFVGGADCASRGEFTARLLAGNPCAVILAEGLAAPDELVEGTGAARVALFTTPLSAPRVIETLARYLAKALADTTSRHGVLMDVLGLGVLITGESGVGKSELGLELISRGHGLVADDVVELQQIGPETIQGRCPPMLRDFLEVRGLGVLNIRSIFGETAVRPRKALRLIVSLEMAEGGGLEPRDRLATRSGTQDILGVEIPTVTLAVAPGRNLAVLVEAAVRNHILLTRGINSTREFIAR
jgi:HPr kinase/phosphorylase